MADNGRDRRRRGLLAGLRRGSYGLMLWLSGQQLAAAGQAPTLFGGAPLNLNLSIEAGKGYSGNPQAVYRIGFSASDPRLNTAFNRLARLLQLRNHEVVEQVRDIRNGIGVDFDLPDAGKLHFMLHPRSDELDRGARWLLGEDQDQDESPKDIWSLGAAVDLVSVDRFDASFHIRDRERRLQVAPQLIIDADRLLGLRGKAVITLQQACWKSSDGRQEEPVFQMRLKWRF